MDDDAMRAWAATQAEVESLRAAVARLAAERDAVIAALILGPDEHGDVYVDDIDMRLHDAKFTDRASAVAAVRRAAGLEEEAPR